MFAVLLGEGLDAWEATLIAYYGMVSLQAKESGADLDAARPLLRGLPPLTLPRFGT